MSEKAIKVFSPQEQYELFLHAYRDFSDVMDFTNLISYFNNLEQKYIKDNQTNIENIIVSEQKEQLISSIASAVLEMEFETLLNMYDDITDILKIEQIDLSYDNHPDYTVKREILRLLDFFNEKQLQQIQYNIINNNYSHRGPRR